MYKILTDGVRTVVLDNDGIDITEYVSSVEMVLMPDGTQKGVIKISDCAILPLDEKLRGKCGEGKEPETKILEYGPVGMVTIRLASGDTAEVYVKNIPIESIGEMVIVYQGKDYLLTGLSKVARSIFNLVTDNDENRKGGFTEIHLQGIKNLEH